MSLFMQASFTFILILVLSSENQFQTVVEAVTKDDFKIGTWAKDNIRNVPLEVQEQVEYESDSSSRNWEDRPKIRKIIENINLIPQHRKERRKYKIGPNKTDADTIRKPIGKKVNKKKDKGHKKKTNKDKVQKSKNYHKSKNKTRIVKTYSEDSKDTGSWSRESGIDNNRSPVDITVHIKMKDLV